MACIDNLFDWILEDIFRLLTHFDRLTCKEVCKRWYNLLMESVIFKKDRHIYLIKQHIRADMPPMSVLMNAKKPYEIYTFDNNYGEINDFIQLFNHVGPSIEELIYDHRNCKILTKVPSLRSLSLPNFSLADAETIVSIIKYKKYNFFFHKLEQLQIGLLGHLNETVYLVKKIREEKLIPQNCHINILQGVFYDNVFNQVEDLCKVMEAAKIIELTVETSETAESKIKLNQFLEAKNLNCDEFKLCCTSEVNPFSFLEALQTKHQNLKKIKLDCYYLPPDKIDLPKITYLKLQLRKFISSLKPLEQLTNLNELILDLEEDYGVSGCRFDHEPLKMPRLKSLELKFSIFCQECFLAVADSFENLIDLNYTSRRTFFWNQFKKLINNKKYLETIKMIPSFIEIQENEEDVLNTFGEPKEYVKFLLIKGMTDFSEEIMENMSQLFPNLKKLHLNTDPNSYSPLRLPKIIQTVQTSFKNIAEFKFEYNMRFYGLYDEEHALGMKTGIINSKSFVGICDDLESFGFPLENSIKETLRRTLDARSDDSIGLTINFDRRNMTSTMCIDKFNWNKKKSRQETYFYYKSFYQFQ